MISSAIRHKFKAKSTEIDKISFHSIKESKRYSELKIFQKIGKVIMFLRQPKFDLPGGVTYSADFIIFWDNGECTIEDVKGYKTKDFIAKKKMVEALYPVIIEVI